MVNGNDDARLRQARQFDRVALAGIYDDYQPLLYRYIYRRVGGVQTAEDLTAVVFQRFLEALKTDDGPERDLRAWLYRVAHNLVIDHWVAPPHPDERGVSTPPGYFYFNTTGI